MTSILIVHIMFAVVAIVSGIVDVAVGSRITRTVHVSSAGGVFLSGVGLVVFGGSVVRACISGGLVIVALLALRYFSARRRITIATKQ